MKTWQQKFDNGKSAQVKTLEKPFGGYPVGAQMYISTPREIDNFIRGLNAGEIVSVAQMRTELATKANTEFTCALTTGIFLRVVAERAFEQYQEGAESKPENTITPFWRVVDPSSKLAEKLSFDKQFITEMRNCEKST